MESKKTDLQNTLFEDFIFEARERQRNVLEIRAVDAKSILEDEPEFEISNKAINFIKGLFKDLFYAEADDHLCKLKKLMEIADPDIFLYEDIIVRAMTEVLKSYEEFEKKPSPSPKGPSGFAQTTLPTVPESSCGSRGT